jgi:ubiquitin-conjugating enzyme E2 J1
MDVEARGQVGGLDADVETRKQLAARSGAFVCSNCGKSNNTIMEEQEKALAELGDDAKKEEEKVPEELRLAYREDLGKKEGGEPKGEAEAKPEAAQSQPEAETPVQPPQELRPHAEQQAAAALLQLGQTGQLPQQAQARAGTEDVWLEMAIWAVGAVLAIIIARKVLMTFFT